MLTPWGKICMIAIIDYDAGNIKSVEKALIALEEQVVVTRNSEEILRADGVILPGVGAFGDAMERLESYGLVETIARVAELRTPLLGVCLGGLKVPHIGWNNLKFPNRGRLFQDLPEDSYVYFVHSYYLQAKDTEIVTATTEYGVQIHASVEKDNIFACQFHPEKSSGVGRKILQNFIAVVKGTEK